MTTLNVRMRTDATPDKLLIELAKSPLVYIRLAGMVRVPVFQFVNK